MCQVDGLLQKCPVCLEPIVGDANCDQHGIDAYAADAPDFEHKDHIDAVDVDDHMPAPSDRVLLCCPRVDETNLQLEFVPDADMNNRAMYWYPSAAEWECLGCN